MRGTPFVGRGQEMLALRSALDAARAGRGRLWLLAGEAGIGKTRLAEEISGEAEAHGGRVLWGRCWEGEGAPAYWPWLQVLRARLRDLDADALRAALGPGAADVAQMVPEIRDRLGSVSSMPALDPALARFRLLESVTALLVATARERPTLLVLDDLHWADAVSLMLLRLLARTLRDAPLLVLCTYRPDEIAADDPRAPELTGIVREAERIDLHGLGDADVARMIETAIGTPPAATLVRAVRERTAGNPFFVRELARLLRGEDGGDAVPPHAVPREVRETIRRRLERLSAPARGLLRVAAVIGSTFRTDVLAAATGSERGRMLVLLDEAAAADIVLAPAAAAPWVFAHVLVRDVLYDELAPAEQRDAHRRVGRALVPAHEADPAIDWAEVAHHFLHAAPDGDVAAAVDAARRAGEQAAGRLAYEEAAAQYGRALAALRGVPGGDPDRECPLQLHLAEALLNAGDQAGAIGAVERAVALARAHGFQAALAGAALLRAARARTGSGDRAVIALLEEALAGAGGGDAALRARLLAHLADVLPPGDAARRRALAGEALALARETNDPHALAGALLAWHWTHWTPDNLAERLAATDEMVALGERLRDARIAVHGYWLGVSDRLEAGDVAGFVAEVDAEARLTRELRDPMAEWVVLVHRTLQHSLAGRFDEAETSAQEALAMGQRALVPSAMPYFGAQLFALRREQSRLDELEAAARELASQFPENVGWRAALAFLYVETDREDEARRELEVVAADDFASLPRDHNWLVAAALCAQVAAMLGDRPRAARLYELLLPFADRHAVAAPGIALITAVAHNLGVVAASLERWDDATRHFDAALAAYGRLGARPALAHAQREYGAMLVRRGDGRRAAALLDAAAATYAALGMTGHVERVATLRPAVPESSEPPRREPNRFEREGGVWTIAYGGTTIRLRDGKGLRYLHELLRRPGTRVHVLDLAVAVDGAPTPVTVGRLEEAGLRAGSPGPAPRTADARARAEYRRRTEDVQAALEEAERTNDLGRASRLREELDFLSAELAEAYGLRSRTGPEPVERARKAVTNRIRAALGDVRRAHEPLWRHLSASLRLGTWCGYRPEAPTTWRVAS